jgi:hypothetical protein
MSLVSLIVAMPVAADFEESIEPYINGRFMKLMLTAWPAAGNIT